MEDAQSIVKIRFLVTFFTFVSVIRQNFEYNLIVQELTTGNSSP